MAGGSEAVHAGICQQERFVLRSTLHRVVYRSLVSAQLLQFLRTSFTQKFPNLSVETGTAIAQAS